jgi:glycosyltransferase involved in cell wall biosynthesis
MRNRSKFIGVVLATYNGAQHLQGQLDSIRRQSVLPAEMVICDDQSNDATASMLQEFKSIAEFPVTIEINDRVFGPSDNFFQAAAKCSSEYIALCDQDDVWLEHKIEVCDASIDKAHPDLILHALVDFYRDESGAEIVSKKWSLPNCGLKPGRAMNPSTIWPGMSLVANRKLFKDVATMRSAWYPYLDKIRNSRPEILYIHWADMHDLFLLTRARMEGTVFLIGEVCAKHRTRDGGHHSDPRGPGLRRIREIEGAWGSSRARPYKLWSLFCADFLDYLDDIDRAGDFSEARSYFARWSLLWSNRADIHSESSDPSLRFKGLASNLNNGAYRSQWAGGFGAQSLVKDGLGALGGQFG